MNVWLLIVTYGAVFLCLAVKAGEQLETFINNLHFLPATKICIFIESVASIVLLYYGNESQWSVSDISIYGQEAGQSIKWSCASWKAIRIYILY